MNDEGYLSSYQFYQSHFIIHIWKKQTQKQKPRRRWWWMIHNSQHSSWVPITAQPVRFPWHVLWRKRQVWDKSKHPMWVPPSFSSTFFLSSFTLPFSLPSLLLLLLLQTLFSCKNNLPLWVWFSVCGNRRVSLLLGGNMGLDFSLQPSTVSRLRDFTKEETLGMFNALFLYYFSSHGSK